MANEKLGKEELVFKLTEVQYLIGEQAYTQLKEIVEWLYMSAIEKLLMQSKQQKLTVSREFIAKLCSALGVRGVGVKAMTKFFKKEGVEVEDE